MRYLLVIPKITSIKDQYYPFPVGIAYVSSSLKASGRTVCTLNLNYKEKPTSELIAHAILENKIDVIGVGGLTAQYHALKEIIDSAKAVKPDIIIVVGGGIITGDPIPAMQALETADVGVIGEGELTICNLADALENQSDLGNVCNIIYFDEDGWKITKQKEAVTDLDSLPYPDYDGFEFGDVVTKIPSDIYSFASGNFVTISLGRSCPFNCTFCFHPSGSKYRQRSLDSVFKEIDYLIGKYPIQNIAITDELFARDLAYVEGFCKRIKDYHLGWTVSLRVDIVTKELAVMLKESGCLSVTFGLESADNRVLKSMRKHITIEQIDHALSVMNEAGMNTIGGFIFGDLEETLETANNTIDWWATHPQYSISLNWIIVYPGSHLYKAACERGIIQDKVQYIKDGCPRINVSKMTDEECKQIAARMDTATRQRIYQITDVDIQYKSFGKVDISGRCPTCNAKNTWTNQDVFRYYANVTCSHCGAVVELLVSDYIDDTFDHNIQKLLKKGKLAIWPITNAVANMFAKSPALMNPNVFIIDSSPIKQGNNIFGRKVSNPSILGEEDIPTVLLASTSMAGNEIREIIKQEYPQVRHIFYAGELILPMR